jgi:DNA (cytosine-5)-methyltransferase 1
MLKHLDLFSGIGGFSLGLESAGLVETVAFCDFDKYCQQVLNKNFPDVPVYGDVKELNYDKLRADGINQIDIITGGYPCQPFSVAGRKKGEQDPRHVWPEMFRLIKELRPTWVIGENVGGHIKLGLDTVLENLESEGYSARTFSISASSIGANHKRERVWIIAHSSKFGRNHGINHREGRQVQNDQERNIEKNKSQRSGRIDRVGEISAAVENSRRSVGREQSSRNSEGTGLWSFETSEWSTDTNQTTRSSEGAETMADSTSERLEGKFRSKLQGTGEGLTDGSETIDSDVADTNCKRGCCGKTGCKNAEDVGQSSRGEETIGWWDVEPDVGRVAHGVPKRVDRLKCLGNSVVPQIPYVIGLAIKETIENEQSIRND